MSKVYPVGAKIVSVRTEEGRTYVGFDVWSLEEQDKSTLIEISVPAYASVVEAIRHARGEFVRRMEHLKDCLEDMDLA